MRHQVRHRFRRDGGFSLLEFVVALALLALLMALLPPVIGMAKRAANLVVQLSANTTTATAMVTVERLLREAMPQIERDETGALKIAFDGQRTSLSFLAPVADGPYGACLCRFKLSTMSRDDGTRREIVLTSERWAAADLSSGNEGETRARRVLTVASGDVAFRYFGVAAGEQSAQWHAAWSRKDTLPELVEITMPAQASSVWPAAPIVVELMLRRPR